MKYRCLKYKNTKFRCIVYDVGLRNARLHYRQFDPGHIMENIIYIELLRCGYSVDVGGVTDRTAGKNAQREIDLLLGRVELF